MADQARWTWLRGETPKQRRRRDYVQTHPVWTAVGAGVYFGACMGLFYLLLGATLVGAVILGLLAGTLFGPLMVVALRRQQTRDRRRPAPHASPSTAAEGPGTDEPA